MVEAKPIAMSMGLRARLAHCEADFQHLELSAQLRSIRSRHKPRFELFDWNRTTK